MNRFNLYTQNLSFLSNKHYIEFESLQKYINLMTNQNKRPRRAHVSADFFAAVLKESGADEIIYNDVLICAISPVKKRTNSTKKESPIKKISAKNFINYVEKNREIK